MVLLLKTIGIWLLMLIAAIANAGIREKLLTPMIGPGTALPISGLLLSLFVFVIIYAAIPFFGATESKIYIYIGVILLIFTLLFEFLFGHFASGRPWHEILQVFNVKKGDLFIVVLLVSLLAPYLSAKWRGFI